MLEAKRSEGKRGMMQLSQRKPPLSLLLIISQAPWHITNLGARGDWLVVLLLTPPGVQ